MKRLDLPAYESAALYDSSVAGLADEALRAKFEENRPTVVEAFHLFDENSQTKTWCNLPRAAHGHPDAIVVGTLSKGELVALYDEGVVKSRGEPRRIYDQIKVSARDECPYCGGIGEMGEVGELGTADHFLPKAYFPTYSVMPVNLVPACQVCNKGMGASFPTDEHLQPLHPYLDEDHFFTTKWLFASVRPGDPLAVDYAANPPADWPEKDRLRVAAHFEACKLGSRYRSRVWSEISPLISQRRSSLSSLSPDQFREHLAVAANEPGLPINGWKRVLYSALVSSNWFCDEEFE
ncbi:HNH endonuclease [Ruegeria sp. A3M17]|uniref:HNH endonuclease n=1 Tax=Ruegeria sp. A3M17 TaxID=2267229 RepID=UPI0011BF70F3|nr:HNH endonuclease [Ruegeria sp. A3M17]